MRAIDEHALAVAPVVSLWSHERHQSRDRHRDPANGTYGYPVPARASRDPRVLAFGTFVKRAVDEALKDRGMSLSDVEAAIKKADPEAKVGRSTIYRWQRGEVESPQRKQVQAFCKGLGIPPQVAGQILGWDGKPPSPEPEPSVDPDLRAVMRRLNDPAVSAEEKTTIRQMLRYLARGQ